MYELSRSEPQRAKLFTAINISTITAYVVGMAISRYLAPSIHMIGMAISLLFFLSTLNLLIVVPHRHQPSISTNTKHPFVPSIRSFAASRPFVFLFFFNLVYQLPVGVMPKIVNYGDEAIFHITSSSMQVGRMMMLVAVVAVTTTRAAAEQ